MSPEYPGRHCVHTQRVPSSDATTATPRPLQSATASHARHAACPEPVPEGASTEPGPHWEAEEQTRLGHLTHTPDASARYPASQLPHAVPAYPVAHEQMHDTPSLVTPAACPEHAPSEVHSTHWNAVPTTARRAYPVAHWPHKAPAYPGRQSQMQSPAVVTRAADACPPHASGAEHGRHDGHPAYPAAHVSHLAPAHPAGHVQAQSVPPTAVVATAPVMPEQASAAVHGAHAGYPKYPAAHDAHVTASVCAKPKGHSAH